MNIEPREITPLLGVVEPAPERVVQQFPPILPALERVQRVEIEVLTLADIYQDHQALGLEDITRTAFALVVLLQLRINRMRRVAYLRDVWDQWSKERANSHDVDKLEDLICSLWKSFTDDYRRPQDIEDVMWLEFPENEGSSRSLRVVDFLNDADAPKMLLSHRLIYLSLLRTWKCGRLMDGLSVRLAKRQRFDTLCTPRVSHCIELVCQLVYLALLIHFLLYPPTSSATTGVSRGHYLMFFAAASLARPLNPSTIPFILVLAAFASSLPSGPASGDIAFMALLTAFAMHVLHLHLPYGATPIFFLSFQFWLPICALLSNCMSQVFVPVLLFFMPLLVMTWSLLYLAMRDTFLYIPTIHILPAPAETRVVLFTLLVVEAVLLLLLPMLILARAPSPPENSSSSKWDRYSAKIGIDARRLFVRTVVTYSGSFYFPPPFNLLRLPFRLLSVALRLFGTSSAPLAASERILWRITVGAVAAGLWMWKPS